MVNHNLSTTSRRVTQHRYMIHGRKRRRLRRAAPVRLDVILCLLLCASAALLPSTVDCFLLRHGPLAMPTASAGTTTRIFQASNYTETVSPLPPRRKRQPNTRVREIVQVLVHATKNDTTTAPNQNRNLPNSKLSSENPSADANPYYIQSNWGPEWAKTRDYLYNSRSDLSVEQVKRVVHFLEESKYVLLGNRQEQDLLFLFANSLSTSSLFFFFFLE